MNNDEIKTLIKEELKSVLESMSSIVDFVKSFKEKSALEEKNSISLEEVKKSISVLESEIKELKKQKAESKSLSEENKNIKKISFFSDDKLGGI